MNIEQLAAQTRLKSKSALFALIGLVLSPLAVVAHTPVSAGRQRTFLRVVRLRAVAARAPPSCWQATSQSERGGAAHGADDLHLEG